MLESVARLLVGMAAGKPATFGVLANVAIAPKNTGDPVIETMDAIVERLIAEVRV